MNDPPSKANPQAEKSNEDMALQELFRLGLKYDRVIGGIMGGCLALALLYCLLAPKIWQAQVFIKLPATDDNSSVLQQMAAPSGNTHDLMSTYVEIARSTNVAQRAALAVGLSGSAEYADEYAKGGWMGVTAALRGKIKVAQVLESTILNIQVRARDPKLAVRLADALGQGFIDANLDFSRSGTRSRRIFIEAEIGKVKQQLNRDEEQLRSFSSENKSLSSLGDANGQGDAESGPLVQLQSEIIGLKMERAELASRYNAAHPSIRNIDAQIQSAQAQFDTEMGKLPSDALSYSRLDRDLKVSEGTYTLLLGELQDAQINENADDTSIVVLDDALPTLSLAAPLRTRILSVVFVVSALFSLVFVWAWDHFRQEVEGEKELARRSGLPVLGLIPDFRLEKNDKTGFSGGKLKAPKQHDASRSAGLITSFGRLYYAESFKIFKVNLSFAGLGPKRKAVAMLSANEGEGKTLCSANLAISLAQSGKRVLLCDADLRKPKVHTIFGIKARADQGLPLLLSGQGSLEAMVVPGGAQENLWVLPCGVLAPNPVELLGSEHLQAVIDHMKKRYDYVVFDAAPVLPVTDSVLLAAKMDGVVLVARYGTGRLFAVEQAVERLQKGEPQFFGCVLNCVDMRKYAYASGYGYGKTYNK